MAGVAERERKKTPSMEEMGTFETGYDETLGSEDGGGKQAFVCIG
jgi:hypothetical protein